MKSKPKRIPRYLLVLALLAQLAAVGALDYTLGTNVHIIALYILPVAFATWYFSPSLGVAVSIGCSAFILRLELPDTAGVAWVAATNFSSRLTVLLFVVYSFASFKRTIDRARKQMQAFEGTLPICTCCHRVDDGEGFWVDFPTYIRTNTIAQTEFRVCPQCEKGGGGQKN